MEICLKKTKLMNWKKCNGVDTSCSCDAYVLNFFCGTTLIYLKMMMNSFLSVFTSFLFFGGLEGLCEGTITPLLTEVCLSKTPPSGVESFFLSLLLSAIILYKQQGSTF